jgi:hypothetical protein
MAIKFDEIEQWKRLNVGASEEALHAASRSLARPLPADYEQFLRRFNGGEGFIKDSYLILWKAEELGPFNIDYEVDKYAPGLFLFASDGGGGGYAFDRRSSLLPIVSVSFIGMSLAEARPVADTFASFLSILEEQT